MHRQLLFVVGLARSGTTVLTELLNSHPDVALGMERYKQLVRHGAADELGAHLFEPARFFDFSDGLTNITPDTSPRWADYYRALEKKYDGATYVGDKVTVLRIGRLVRRFPTARLLVIVRDPVEVAASWQRRADDPTDRGWRAARGAPQAAAEWNRGVRRLLRAADEAAGRVRVVEHGTFFGDSTGDSLQGVLEWLNLPRTTDMDATFALVHGRFASGIRDRPATLAAADLDAVKDTVDRRAWRAARRLVV